jgi:hypothetical protein
MALKKLSFAPGVNRESTSYAAEGTWYICDKVRFRSGKPEKIGGWSPISSQTFLGTARNMWAWTTNSGYINTGVGTSLKYYVENGGEYYDITPLRVTRTLGTNPFATTNGSTTVVVTDTGHGAISGDFVTFSGSVGFNGLSAGNLNREFQITLINANSYSIVVPTAATGAGSGGGAVVSAAYQITSGNASVVLTSGWGAGTWGGVVLSGPDTGWGVAAATTVAAPLRLWNAHNYGQDLIYGPRGGPLYYWSAASLPAAFSNRGVLVSSLAGASSVPLFQNEMIVSDTSRFVIVFGTNEIGTSTLDPLLIRWSDQEDVTEWYPGITNQAGGIRLSSGSKIIAAVSTKQEIIVFTDAAVYSMQYVGPPYVWNLSQIADNTSIMSPNSFAVVNNVVYWMGADKFYMYSGRVETLPCSLRQHVFADPDTKVNFDQRDQVICGTNEGYTEIWWFYCSTPGGATPDRYVVFNHLDRAWYYGTMERTAWLDNGVQNNPIAIKSNRILNHEVGNDDDTGEGPVQGMHSYIESADFGMDDGDRLAFCWRMIPDMTFRGSIATNPSVTVVVKPRDFPGQVFDPESPEAVVRSYTVPVEQYNHQVYLRFRGRQMAFRIESADVGVQWQLGVPRIDIRPDGRKS